MSLWKHYHTPKTVDEALELLASYDGRARVVAGGTDLILEMHEGRRPPVQALVDVTHIDHVEVGDEVVLLGDQGGESITASELAAVVGTVPHDILTSVSRRVPRFYTR